MYPAWATGHLNHVQLFRRITEIPNRGGQGGGTLVLTPKLGPVSMFLADHPPPATFPGIQVPA